MNTLTNETTNYLNTDDKIARQHIKTARAYIEQAEQAGDEAAKAKATTALYLATGAKTSFRKTICAALGSEEQQTFQRKGLNYLKSAERALFETAARLEDELGLPALKQA